SIKSFKRRNVPCSPYLYKSEFDKSLAKNTSGNEPPPRARFRFSAKLSIVTCSTQSSLMLVMSSYSFQTGNSLKSLLSLLDENILRVILSSTNGQPPALPLSSSSSVTPSPLLVPLPPRRAPLRPAI